jgi:site-specific DNA recombinase
MGTRKPKAAAIYTRISEDRLDEGGGVGRQEQDCRKLADSLGWQVAGVYADNNVSAYRKRVRPQWARLLADLAAGLVDGLLVYDFDRMARQPRDLEDLIDLVERHGFPVANVTGEVDLSTSGGRTVARVLVAFSLKASDDTGRRVKRKHEASAEQGKPHGGPRPYGFLADRRTPHPEEASIVAEAVRRFLMGDKIHAIAKDFRRRGIPTAKGGVWAPQNLRRVLSRPEIGGIAHYRCDEKTGRPLLTDHRFRGIVSEQEWLAVEAILSDPSRRVTPGPKRSHLLSGFGRCGVCGELLRVNHRRSGRSIALSCEKRTQTTERHVSRSMAGVEELVVEAVLRWLQEFKFATPKHVADSDGLAVQIAHLEAKIREVEAQATVIPAASLGRILTDLDRRITTLRKEQIARHTSSGVVPFVGENARNAWESADLERRRTLLEHLVEAIVIDRCARRPGSTSIDPSTVRLRWRNGSEAVPSADREEWLRNALAVAPDADDLAGRVGGVVDLGIVVENPWRTWPGGEEVA